MGRPMTRHTNGSREVATTVDQALPAYYKTDDLGTDGIDSSDLTIPRLKICQGQSNVKGNNKEIKDGDWYNSLTSEGYGASTSLFILGFTKSRVWFSKDFRFEGSEFIDPATKKVVRVGPAIEEIVNDKDRWDEGKDSFNYMVVLKKDLLASIKDGTMPSLMIYSAMSAATKPARQLNGKLKYNSVKQIPIYAQEVICESRLEVFNAGKAYMPIFRFPSTILGEKEITLLRSLYQIGRDMQGKVLQQDGEHHDEKIPF